MKRKKLIHCPKCGGTNCSSYRRGYNWGCGCLGFLLFNVLGLLLGCIGQNKRVYYCKDCGKDWEMK